MRLNLDSTDAPALYGLILTGGRNSRMGREKALLEYSGSAQGLVCFNLLSSLCQQVFLSCRAEQWDDPAFSETFQALPLIMDAYSDIGPLAGLLSAMECYPAAAWLVLACDMPLMDQALLAKLCSERNPAMRAIAFAPPLPDTDRPCFEPLCTIYEPKCLPEFQAAMRQGRTGLQGLLVEWAKDGRVSIVSTEWALRDGRNVLQGANTPDEAERFRCE